MKRPVIRILLLTLFLSLGRGNAFPQPLLSIEEAERAGKEPLYNFEFRDAEIRDVLLTIGKAGNLNLLFGPEVTGTVTLSLKQVPLQEVIEAILRNNNLTTLQERSITRVMRRPTPAESEEPLAQRVLPFRFAQAKEVLEAVKSFLSGKGTMTADVRANALILQDLPTHLDRIVRLVAQLDMEPPQVMIEARIVEANSDFSRDFGINWGGTITRPSLTNNFNLGAGAGQIKGGDLAVNFPSLTAAAEPIGALALSLGRVGGTSTFLNLRLSALETSGKIRILSNPRILTIHNKEAQISTGTEILVPTTILTGGTPGVGGVTTINAKLELSVTPQVTAEDQILTRVRVDKKEPDFSRAVQGIPPLTTSGVVTNLLVKDGETIVIGGIFIKNESTGASGVPFLSKIPVLGLLFKREVELNKTTDLLIFITQTMIRPPIKEK